MSEGKRITFADIKRQMELASEDIETWPTWMRRAAGLDGEGPDYNTLRAENARLKAAICDIWNGHGLCEDHGQLGYWKLGKYIDLAIALQPERGKP